MSTYAHVVHTTAKQVIWRRGKNENVCEMFMKEKCTCKACKSVVFHCQICKFCDILVAVVVVVAQGPAWQTRTHCCRHIVAHDVSWDTTWMLCFHVAQTGKHLWPTQNVSEQSQKYFLGPEHNWLASAKNVARAGKHLCRQQCVCSNVFSFARAFNLPNISRRHLADYVKKLHHSACRTCSTIIFSHSTNQIIDLWRCPCRLAPITERQRHKLRIWLMEWGQISVLHVRHALWCNFFT